jgi:hypothetical protein
MVSEAAQYNLRGFIIDENDQLFISGFDQIYQLNASNLMTNAYSPDPFLTKLVINNAEVHAGLELNGQSILEKNIGYQKRIVLNHQNKDFTISFASASYLNSSENKYRYKLQGYDNDWHTGSEKLAHYTNLSPGKYTFEVFSANNDGVWSQSSAQLQISVKPSPFLSFWAVIFVHRCCYCISFSNQKSCKRQNSTSPRIADRKGETRQRRKIPPGEIAVLYQHFARAPHTVNPDYGANKTVDFRRKTEPGKFKITQVDSEQLATTFIVGESTARF